MFTGIIQDQGRIESIERHEKGVVLNIHSKLNSEHFTRGNSIAVNGVCLTVETFNPEQSFFTATVVPETLSKTTLDSFSEADLVNLEAPLTLQTPIAGHLTLGHVDGVAKVLETAPLLKVALDEQFLKYCPVKGSITINGVSLTIAEADENSVSIALIPETKEKTNLGALELGDEVNFEIDALARYLERLNQDR